MGGAFSGCTALTSVTIPNSVTSIGEYSFSRCSGLTSVTIGNSVTSIGSDAFRECTALTSIAIPNSVTSIGNRAFYGCTALTSVIIPNSVTEIEYSAFDRCIGLTSATIGNSVTSIGSYAFSRCFALKSIAIPNSVTSIGSYAFEGCTGLARVYSCNPIPPTCGSDVFYSVSKTDCILYVPAGSYSTYWFTSDWGEFKNIVEMKENYSYIDTYFNVGGKVLIENEKISYKEIENGKSVTFTITPNDGYEVESAKFNSEDVTSQIRNNTFTTPAISQNSIFDVVFKQTETVAISVINQDKISIQSASNGITIETTEQMPVSVYTISGQIIYQTIANGKADIPLNKGIYIVRVNNESQKVIVK